MMANARWKLVLLLQRVMAPVLNPGRCVETNVYPRNGAVVFIITINNGLSAMDSVSGKMFHAMVAVSYTHLTLPTNREV